MRGPDVSSRRAVGALARDFDRRVPELTGELIALYVELVPELQGDDGMQDLVTASTAANLSAIFDLLAHDIPAERAPVPLAAAELARRLAQRDVPLEALLRAYRLGEHRFVQWWLDELGSLGLGGEEALAAARQVTAAAAAYIDRVCEELVGMFAAERRLWLQRTDAARAAQVRAVLDDEAVDVDTAEAMTGRRLRCRHVAVVLWADAATGGGDLAASATAALARACEDPPLVVPADAGTAWAWVSGPAPPLLDEEALAAALEDLPGLRAAVGQPGAGLAGFRSSHREAQRARAVSEAAVGRTARVTTFAQVSIPALLVGDLDAVRVWVHRTLGDLARDDAAMAKLRETARVFLETGGSWTEAAARLHLHRNTVLYRLRKAEQVRGRPLSDGRLDVEVALTVCAWLGRAVLPPA